MKHLLSSTILLILGFSQVNGQLAKPSTGFGLDMGSQGSGFFVSRAWSTGPEFTWTVEGRYYDLKNEDELVLFNYYTWQYETANEKFVVVIPILAGTRYYPFAGKIANNFSPYVTVKAGPILTFDGAEKDAWTKRWGQARTLVSFGGFIGGGVEFLWVAGSGFSISAGYDVLPMKGRVDGQTHYNGLLIHLGYTWRK